MPKQHIVNAKRNRRKRKRKVVSESSSSSSSSSSSEDEQPPQIGTPPATKQTTSSIQSASSSSSSSDSDSDAPAPRETTARGPSTTTKPVTTGSGNDDGLIHHDEELSSRSPSPEAELPTLLSPKTDGSNKVREEKERLLKERFRKLYMSTLAEEFKDDLNKIRNEPDLTQSRLAMLIDALGVAADGFTSSAGQNEDGNPNDVNEMELVLEAAELQQTRQWCVACLI
ncbi:hypothetical protein FRB99_003783 [Tulasnella sp. 403]|nr:hypothetical protein FRB99_003783 [Tulasnella sp. 403]